MTEPPHRRGQDHDGLLHRPAITPALTAEEWATAHRRIAEFEGAGWHVPAYFLAELAQWQRGERMERESTHAASRHALAALALHGQPFGFTREDVEMLRDSAEDDHTAYYNYDKLIALADRIEALLPPA